MNHPEWQTVPTGSADSLAADFLAVDSFAANSQAAQIAGIGSDLQVDLLVANPQVASPDPDF